MPHVTGGNYFALNAGQVSEQALARIDLAKMRLAAEVQENLLPTVLGPAIFRPGFGFVAQTYDDEEPFLVPFVFNAADKAIVVVTEGRVEFLVNGAYISRPSVSTAVTNGLFNTDLTGWTDSDESGATSAWVTGGYLGLQGNGFNYAIRSQQVTVSGGDANKEHALRIVVTRGPVRLMVGTTAGAGDYLAKASLGTGIYSLAFTPTGDFYIELAASDDVQRLVSSIAVEVAGRAFLQTPWGSDHANIRYAQSGDIIYVACEDIHQKQIERHAADSRSWGIVDYLANDGPFRTANTDTTTLTPSATRGIITIEASRAVFDADMVGALFRLTHSGQTASATLAAVGQATPYIKVVGVSSNRVFDYSLSGITTSVVVMERSFAEPGAWRTFSTFSSDDTDDFDDDLDNEIVYYRFRVLTYGGGDSISASLTYDGSIQRGVVRITAFTDATEVEAEVISQLGTTDATDNWEEGAWSDYRGYPSSVGFHDGRLVWGWLDKVYCSVSDSFNSFDSFYEGDAGPVVRNVATGPVEGIRWILSTQRLLAGTASAEISIRSSSFDEPLTPTKFTAREMSTRGCANLPAVKIDSRGVFVQRNLSRVFELVYSLDAQDYSSQDVTRLCPDICSAGVKSISVQRSPDTRVWFVLDDGTVAVLTYERDEEVIAWTPVTTDGDVKAVTVLPGEDEDEVYIAVDRNSGNMCLERMAMTSECEGGLLSKNLDAHVAYSGISTDTISGLDHLDGLEVLAWADGAAIVGAHTVSGGSVILDDPAGDVVVGLAYTGRYKSVKVANPGAGIGLSRAKRIVKFAPLLSKVSVDGVTVGRSFDELYNLSGTYHGATIGAETVYDTYDEIPQTFGGAWGPDERICLQVVSPHCATILGFSIDIDAHDPNEDNRRGNG